MKIRVKIGKPKIYDRTASKIRNCKMHTTKDIIESRLKKRRIMKVTTTTQMQATPILYGEDAKAVLREAERTPTSEQRKQLLEKYRKKFEGIKTKGF